QARVPARWITVTVVAGVVLAAMGTDAVVGRRLDRKALIALGATVAAVALLIVTNAMSTPGRKVVAIWIVAAAGAVVAALLPRGPNRGAGLALIGLPAVVVIGELGLSAYHGTTPRPSTTASVEQYGGGVVRFLDGQPGRSVAVTFDELGDPA